MSLNQDFIPNPSFKLPEEVKVEFLCALDKTGWVPSAYSRIENSPCSFFHEAPNHRVFYGN